MARGSMEILASLAASEFLRMRAEREQVKLESQLRQMEKMQAIGQLAGGIAHDINNQLGCILGYADIIHDVNKEPVINEFIRKISQSVSRSADLVKKLLAFSRHGNCIMKPVNVTALIHEVVGLLQHSVDKSIALSMVAADGQQYVMGDPSQLQNALLNLGLNARDAILPEGGTVTYEVHAMKIGPEEQKQFPTCLPGEYVCLQVHDNGVGIPPEIIDRIFEPFFTTKPEGKGTGLGLAAVYGTITSHRGYIDVKSKPGEGSLFTILLPYYAPPAEGEEEQEEPIPFGSGTILVIDDEIDIRDTVAMMLRKCGFTVITAGDGLEGVQIYIKYFGKINMVILDMIMPGIDGKNTFERLIEIDPAVKVIIVSGYSVDGRVQAVLDKGARSFLQKPFRNADLLRMTADVLNKQ
jgi:nitrogen-specific signal transduction histidine kinase